MGQLLYGSPPESFAMEDRTLAHVEIVVLAKLRRNEAFALLLDEPDGGRSTIWINSASTLHFRFDKGTHEINRRWLEDLIDSANGSAGMRVLPETSA